MQAVVQTDRQKESISETFTLKDLSNDIWHAYQSWKLVDFLTFSGYCFLSFALVHTTNSLKCTQLHLIEAIPAIVNLGVPEMVQF